MASELNSAKALFGIRRGSQVRMTRLPLEGFSAGIIFIGLFWLIAFVPFAGFPSLHLEEGTHASPAKDLLAHHHWLAPEQLGGIPYYNKPPMLPWLMAVTGLALGTLNEWAVRIPALLSTLAIAILVYCTARPIVSQRSAIAASAAAILTPSVMLVSSVGETDLLATSFSFAAFVVFIQSDRRGGIDLPRAILIGALMGGAALSKGPVPLLFPVGGMVLFRLFYGPKSDLAWLVLSLLVAAGLLGIWALPKLGPMTRAVWFSQMRLDTALHPASLLAWLSSMLRFIGYFFVENLPVSLAVLPVLTPTWRRRLGIPERFGCAITCYALAGTALLTIGSATRARYALPAEPALAVAAGLILEQLSSSAPKLPRLAIAALVPLAFFQIARADIITLLRADVVQRNRQVGEAIDAEIRRAPAPIVLLNGPLDSNCLFYLHKETDDLIVASLPTSGPVWLLFGNGGVVWPESLQTRITSPMLDLRSRDNEPLRLYRVDLSKSGG